MEIEERSQWSLNNNDSDKFKLNFYLFNIYIFVNIAIFLIDLNLDHF